MIRALCTLTTLIVSLLCAGSALAQPRVFFDFRGPEESFSMVVDGKDYAPSFFTGFLAHKEAFKSQAEAYRLMEEAYADQVTGNIVFWGLGIATPIAWLAGTSNSDISPVLRSNVYWGTFLGGILGGFYYQGRAGKSFLKAVNTYNGG